MDQPVLAEYMQMQAKSKAGCVCKGMRCGPVKDQTPILIFTGAELLLLIERTPVCLTKQGMWQCTSAPVNHTS